MREQVLKTMKIFWQSTGCVCEEVYGSKRFDEDQHTKVACALIDLKHEGLIEEQPSGYAFSFWRLASKGK